MNKNPHIGVYGINFFKEKVLLIKKARGPYIGLYDLPGGRIEFNEKIEDTLRREIDEETGSSIVASSFLGFNEHFCKYYKDDIEKEFHHIGLYYIIEINYDILKTSSDGEDSLGSLFVSMDQLSDQNVSPIAWSMIQKAVANQAAFWIKIWSLREVKKNCGNKKNVDIHTAKEKNHGRLEVRVCKIFNNLENIDTDYQYIS